MARRRVRRQTGLVDGRAVLASAVDYLYGEAQHAHDVAERDAYSLALAVCGAARRGEPDPLVAASYACFGSSLPRYLKHRDEMRDMAYAELRTVASQSAQNALVAATMPVFEPAGTGVQVEDAPSDNISVGMRSEGADDTIAGGHR